MLIVFFISRYSNWLFYKAAVLLFVVSLSCSYFKVYLLPFFFLLNLFIFGCIGSSLLRAGFLYLQRAGATLHCSAGDSHCGGFSCCRAQALGEWASVAVARRLSSCGTGA